MNKNYLIIGNPVKHSLSPKIHNFWFNENNINADYKKETLTESELENLVKRIREGDISGANVTVPFKQKIIPFLDRLSDLAKKTQSVNTLYRQDDLVIGDNTDVYGFSQSVLNKNISLKNKDALILGAGGVVPSVITALEDLSIGKIYIKNRTQEKLLKLKESYIFFDVNLLDVNFCRNNNLIEISKYIKDIKKNNNILGCFTFMNKNEKQNEDERWQESHW